MTDLKSNLPPPSPGQPPTKISPLAPLLRVALVGSNPKQIFQTLRLLLADGLTTSLSTSVGTSVMLHLPHPDRPSGYKYGAVLPPRMEMRVDLVPVSSHFGVKDGSNGGFVSYLERADVYPPRVENGVVVGVAPMNPRGIEACYDDGESSPGVHVVAIGWGAEEIEGVEGMIKSHLETFEGGLTSNGDDDDDGGDTSHCKIGNVVERVREPTLVLCRRFKKSEVGEDTAPSFRLMVKFVQGLIKNAVAKKYAEHYEQFFSSAEEIVDATDIDEKIDLCKNGTSEHKDDTESLVK